MTSVPRWSPSARPSAQPFSSHFLSFAFRWLRYRSLGLGRSLGTHHFSHIFSSGLRCRGLCFGAHLGRPLFCFVSSSFTPRPSVPRWGASAETSTHAQLLLFFTSSCVVMGADALCFDTHLGKVFVRALPWLF